MAWKPSNHTPSLWRSSKYAHRKHFGLVNIEKHLDENTYVHAFSTRENIKIWQEP